MQIKKKIYYQSLANYQNQWMLLDNILIDLCNKYPKHSSIEEVSAKVLLIGRGFATGIERQVSSDGSQGSSLDKTAHFLVKEAKRVDSQIKRLYDLHEPLTINNLSTIIEVHGFISKLLRSITRDKRYATSFAAKYLHFHAPIVPIYDSISYANAWRFRDKNNEDLFDGIKTYDENYLWYIRCFFQLYQELKSIDKKCTARLAELYLMWF
jgi:hypothetical protein